MDGESMEATVEVIGSPCTKIIGKAIQNPGDTEMHVILLQDLGWHCAQQQN